MADPAVTRTSCRPLPARVQAHVARARQFGLRHSVEYTDGGYVVRLHKPRIDQPRNAAEEFANQESVCIVGDQRQIRRVEWRTSAGVLSIKAGDIGHAISAVAL